MLTVQAMSTMLEALQRSLDEESEGRKAEAAARAAAQERSSSADEKLGKLEWESNQATASLQRKVGPAETFFRLSVPQIPMALQHLQ